MEDFNGGGGVQPLYESRRLIKDPLKHYLQVGNVTENLLEESIKFKQESKIEVKPLCAPLKMD